MGNKYLEDRSFQDSKDLLVMLLKLMEKETKGIYKFVGEYPTGIYYTTGKKKNQFCICSSERTVLQQAAPFVRDISIAQFILDIDLFYRIQKGIPLSTRTHEAMLKFLEVYLMFKDQFSQKVKMMIDYGKEPHRGIFFEDVKSNYALNVFKGSYTPNNFFMCHEQVRQFIRSYPGVKLKI